MAGYRSKKAKIISLILVLILVAVLITGGVWAYFTFRDNTVRLDYDFATGMTVKNRVANAQYVPDANVLAGKVKSNSVKRTSVTPDRSDYLSDLTFSLKDYQNIVDELAILTGTATRSETDIWGIKEEIYTVLDMVPAFGEWFQLPHYFEAQHAQDGFNNYYYKFDYDKNSEKISVIRMSWGYCCELYDSSKNKVYSTYYDDDLVRYQVMQVNYYYNENNKEVVECSVVDFARFKKKFYPIECQYLENVQDTSTTKIQSVLRKELVVYQDKLKSNPGGNVDSALDIDTYREDGVMKKVMQLNYTDSNNVEMIKIEQNSGTEYFSDINTTNIAYYLRQAENAVYFIDGWDYYDPNSYDKIDFYNEFYFNKITKDGVIGSFLRGYGTRVVMSTPTRGYSTRNVCSKCYNRTIDYGLLVYKCKHNKNWDRITRGYKQMVCTSPEYEAEIYELIPWNISKHLAKFAGKIGVPDEIIETYAPQICREMDEIYSFESNIDTFLTKVFKEFIENISLTKDVESLYNTITKNAKELKVEYLNTSAISTVIELEDFEETTSVADNVVTAYATATLKPNILLEKDAKYSIGLVLYDSLNNINFTLLTNYTVYDGSDLTLTLNGSYDISDFILRACDPTVATTLDFTLGYALVKESKVCDTVCSGYQVAKIEEGTYHGFENTVNGFQCSYEPVIAKEQFHLQIFCLDIEEPKIELYSLNDNQIAFDYGATVYDLLALLIVTDNDVVNSMSITHEGIEYESMDEALVAGTNEITVTDRTGNTATLTFTVTIKEFQI